MSYILIAFSSLLFGILPSFQNMAILNGASAEKVLVVCNVFCLIGNFFLCLLNKIDLRINAKELCCYLLTGICGLFVTDLCLNLAYTKMPVGIVTTIHFVYPLLVCLGNVLFLHETFSRNKILAAVLSVWGLILLAGRNTSYSFAGIMLALVSAIAYAFNLIMVDRSLISSHKTLKKNFYIYLFSSVTSFLTYAGKPETMQFPADQMIWMVSAGMMLMLGSLCLTKGISMLGSSDAAFISVLEPITSLLVSSLLYHYDLELGSIIGCILIILSLFPIIKGQEF